VRSVPSSSGAARLCGEADDDAAFDLVEVEDVGGMAHAEQDEVGGVDGVRDGLLAEQREVFGDEAGGGAMVTLRMTRAVKRPQSSGASMRTGNFAGAALISRAAESCRAA
jgi:hypothetical protein